MFIPLRDENPVSRFPYVTILIITLNVLFFLFQIFSSEGFQFLVYKMGAIPYEITHFKSLASDSISRLSPPLTLITSMFLHGGFFHLIFNMWFLWIFGNNVEDYLGPIRYILFYLIGGLGASLTHVIFNINSQAPMIGASGAIAGVLGAYLVLFPNAKILTLIFPFFFISIIPIPAAFLLLLWFLLQILNIGLGGGVAWFAHIGGFLIGIALIKLFTKPKKPKVWVH